MAPARFFGKYEHSLDAKGRVILPVKFRAAFAAGGYLGRFHNGCLALWTPEEFEHQMLTMQQGSNESSDQRNLARVWAKGLHEVEVDRQGRLPIPALLRHFAGLTSEVWVQGAIDRVELWDPATWDANMALAEQRLAGIETASGS